MLSIELRPYFITSYVEEDDLKWRKETKFLRLSYSNINTIGKAEYD